jgi:hypothetical protein
MKLNLAKFTFCIQHEDVDIVKEGLSSFVVQIVQECNVQTGIGLYTPQSSPIVLTGLLKTYVDTSSSLEELFSLFGMSGYDRDMHLCLYHLTAMSSILDIVTRSHSMASNDNHGAKTANHESNSNNNGKSLKGKDANYITFCERVVTRILVERSKLLIAMLNSNNADKIQATLILLITMCRVSPSSSNHVYWKLILFARVNSNDAAYSKATRPVLSLLSHEAREKGPMDMQEEDNEDEDRKEVGSSSMMDARQLLICLLSVLIQQDTNNAEVLSDLCNKGSLLRRILSSIKHKMSQVHTTLSPSLLLGFFRGNGDDNDGE